MKMIKFVIASAPVVIAWKGPLSRDVDCNKPHSDFVRGLGSVAEIGARTGHEMEDRVDVKHHKYFSAFYVFDGHGGDFASTWLKENMHDIVTEQIRDIFTKQAASRDMTESLANAFAIADNKLRS